MAFGFQWLRDLLNSFSAPPAEEHGEQVGNARQDTLSNLRTMRDKLKLSKSQLRGIYSRSQDDYQALVEKVVGPEGLRDTARITFTVARLLEEAKLRDQIKHLEEQIVALRARADELAGRTNLGERHGELLAAALNASRSDAEYESAAVMHNLKVEQARLELNIYLYQWPTELLEEPVMEALLAEVRREIGPDNWEEEFPNPRR